MSDKNIVERLIKLEAKFKESSFLNNQGLGNEVGIHVFSYDPKDELIVREFIKRITVASHVQPYRAYENDLFEIFLQVCDDFDILVDLFEYEKGNSGQKVITQISNFASPQEYLSKFIPKQRVKGQDIVLISGVGKVFPFMRSHVILENIQPIISDVPVVLFYPGEYTNQTLRLFNHLNEANYYRAFKIAD